MGNTKRARGSWVRNAKEWARFILTNPEDFDEEMYDLFEIGEIMDEANRSIDFYRSIIDETPRTEWMGKHYEDSEMNQNSGRLLK